MREIPPYAIVKSSHLKYAGEKNYQDFFKDVNSDGISLIGLRVNESHNRRQSIGSMDLNKDTTHNFYPIYDWTDEDVWKYIQERGLEFPEIYIRLYEAGVSKSQLRLCAFFGDKTTQGLRWIAETDPELWEKIEKRMPNAYLAMLYWDSEMFARSTTSRKKAEGDSDKETDYREIVGDMLFRNTKKYHISHDTLAKLSQWRSLFIRTDGIATQKDYKKMKEVLIFGDPKGRDLRLLQTRIFDRYNKRIKNQKGIKE